jgi:hypothetical protein
MVGHVAAHLPQADQHQAELLGHRLGPAAQRIEGKAGGFLAGGALGVARQGPVQRAGGEALGLERADQVEQDSAIAGAEGDLLR